MPHVLITLSNVTTPYSKCTTPYIIGMVSCSCMTQYISNHVTNFFFYILYIVRCRDIGQCVNIQSVLLTTGWEMIAFSFSEDTRVKSCPMSNILLKYYLQASIDPVCLSACVYLGLSFSPPMAEPVEVWTQNLV